MMHYQSVHRCLKTHRIWRSICAAAAALSLSVTAFGQQGESASVSLPTRLTNGHSLAYDLVSVNGTLYGVFRSDATNLVPGVTTRAIYYQNLRTGEITALPAPSGYTPIIASAAKRADLGGMYIAAAYRLQNGYTVIGVYDTGTGQWRWYDAPELVPQTLRVTSDGDVYYARSSGSGRAELVRRTNNSIETLAVLPANGYLRLSVSEDGNVIVCSVNNAESPQDNYHYIRVRYRVTETTYAVAESRLSGSAHAYFLTLADDGQHILRQPGFLHEQVELIRLEVDRQNRSVLLNPTERISLPRQGIIVGFAGGLIAYITRPDDGSNNTGLALRVLDLNRRVDFPIIRRGYMPQVEGAGIVYWMQHRMIAGGVIYFRAMDTREHGGVIPGDKNLFVDVFTYDVSTYQLAGVTTGTQPVKGLSQDLAIGYDSSLVAFTSDARLVSGKTTPHHDVFIARGSELIRIVGSGGEPNGSSFDVSVPRGSGSQLIVVFSSVASNLTPTDPDSSADVFMWRDGDGLQCLSCQLDGDSIRPVVASNGTVYFISSATNTGVGSVPQAYQWLNGRITVVGRGLFESVERVVVSPSGQWVVLTARRQEDAPLGAYLFNANNLGQVVWSLERPGHDIIATDVSDNAKIVLQTTAPLINSDANGLSDVYVYDYNRRTFVLASRNPVGSIGDSDSYEGTIDVFGRYVAFSSRARNLVPMDLNGIEDVFVYDLQRNTLYCASRNPNGLLVGGSTPKISGSGTQLVFATGSADIVWMPFSEGVFVARHTLGCAVNGDVNLDGRVDDADLSLVLFTFGRQGASSADLNVDDQVNDADLMIVLTNYGSQCGYSWAGGGDDGEEDNSNAPYLVRLGSGKAILYYPTAPKFSLLYGESLQRQEIDRAIHGAAPYPVVGGIYNPWRETFGCFLSWSSEEVDAFRRSVDPEPSADGDVAPAWGNPFNYKWQGQQYTYQPRHDTYVRFRPEMNFEARACEQFMHFDGLGILDYRFLGSGRDEIAKLYVRAGMTPGWTGYKVEAYFNGFKVWDDGWSTQGNWQKSHTYALGHWDLFAAFYPFTLLGMPASVFIDVDAYARADFSMNLVLSPSRATASFNPRVGLWVQARGGVGGRILGVLAQAGAAITLNPALELQLPINASIRTEPRQGGGCDLVANARVDLNLRALVGTVDVGIFTTCFKVPVQCPKCNEGDRKTILGIPVICCANTCSSNNRRHVKVWATLRVASWPGLTYNLATILDRTWRWQVK